MKTIQYVMIGALMVGFSVSAVAQEDHKAVIDQVSKIIKAKGADTQKQVNDIFKLNKKNVDVITAIGRAYLDVKDTVNAQKYADLALKRDNHYGEAYILCGDIQAAKDNGGEAASWYNQATMMDPKNPEGYRRYALAYSKVSPSSAAAKLEELRKQVPGYPVDIIMADIYQNANKIDKAVEYYKKVDPSKMTEAQIVNFALDYFLQGDFSNSLQVASGALQKYPKSPALNRIAFFDLTNLKRFDEALSYADELFNQSENAKITESDYLYYGYAYMGKNDYDNAIAMFNKSYELNTDNEQDKSDALKNIATAYESKGDLVNATAAYDKYLKSLKEITAYDLGNLASMYQKHAESLKGTEKDEALKKADEIWGQIADKFPSVADVATYNRAHIAYSMDPDTKLGLAKPHYEKLAELINAKSQKSDSDKSRLVECYRYLGYYYLLKNDKSTSDGYWHKVLELDPENATAKQALGIK